MLGVLLASFMIWEPKMYWKVALLKLGACLIIQQILIGSLFPVRPVPGTGDFVMNKTDSVLALEASWRVIPEVRV